MPEPRLVTTVDSHTAGHPTRVVTGGVPPLKGGTVAARRDDFRARYDALRPFLLHEPRGHAAMVGAVLTESRTADFGAFFLGSYTYLEMCGHATIGLAVTLDALGLLATSHDAGAGAGAEAAFSLEVPAGLVRVQVAHAGGRPAAVRLETLPAFVAAREIAVDGPAGQLTLDIACGGNWYALVEAAAAGVSLTPAGVPQAMAVGAALKAAVNTAIAAGTVPRVAQPVDSVLFHHTDQAADGPVSTQLVVLAANKFDRSPCGTGSAARLAQLADRGALGPEQTLRTRNILGLSFTVRAVPDPTLPSGHVRPEVSGMAHVTGYHTFVLTPDDPLPQGFLCA